MAAPGRVFIATPMPECNYLIFMDLVQTEYACIDRQRQILTPSAKVGLAARDEASRTGLAQSLAKVAGGFTVAHRGAQAEHFAARCIDG